jgi:hypothetical protein
VLLKVAQDLPAPIKGIGLFIPGAEYLGVGRISTGLGTPHIDPESDEARLWSALATEMGANPGNWVADSGNTIKQPATAFGIARKLPPGGRIAVPGLRYVPAMPAHSLLRRSSVRRVDLEERNRRHRAR